MSWENLSAEVAGEFGSASGREFFDSDGYSFQRLAKLNNADLAKLAASSHFKRWFRKVYAEDGERLRQLRERKRLWERLAGPRAAALERNRRHRLKVSIAKQKKVCSDCGRSWSHKLKARGPSPKRCPECTQILRAQCRRERYRRELASLEPFPKSPEAA